MYPNLTSTRRYTKIKCTYSVNIVYIGWGHTRDGGGGEVTLVGGLTSGTPIIEKFSCICII